MLTRLRAATQNSVSLPGRYVLIAAGLTLFGLLAGTGLGAVMPVRPPAPVVAARPAFASTATWQRCDEELPSIATVLTVKADPAHPGILYAGTHQPPGLWRSANSGKTWVQEVFAGETRPGCHPVYALHWDAGRQRWWAGTTAGLFYRSTDSPVWQPAGGPDGPIYDLAQDASGRIYAVQAETGLFRLDRSDNWTQLRDTDRALAVNVSPDGRVVFLGTAGDGLWISHDGGTTWQQVPDFKKAYVSVLWTDQQVGQQILLSTSQAAYGSDDQGHTWHSIPTLGGRSYSFHLAPDGTLFAGLKGRVARSRDDGQTWTLRGEGLAPDAIILGLDTVSQPEGGDMLFAATRDGIYASGDRGNSWQRHSTGLGGIQVKALARNSAGGMIAATPQGLYRRLAGAATWQPIAPTFRHTHIYDLSGDASGHTLYAGTERGLLRSADDGQTWQEVPSELASHGMPGVLADPGDPNHLFIRLAFERIYESYDGGQTWQARWEGMETQHVVLSMARGPSGEFLAGTDKGVFRWNRQDNQWHKEPLALPNPAVYAVAFDPSGREQYAGSTTGLWCKSGDSGWRRCGAGTIHNSVSALVALPAGHVYAGTRYAGLYRSCDSGATWHQVAGIPADATVNDLLVDSQASLVYAATDRGLFEGPDRDCPPATASPIEKREDQGGLAVLAQILASASKHAAGRPLPAVHTLRPDDSLLNQARDIGFQAIVQVFSWAEIEPAQGVWYWEYPDFLARATAFYDLDLIVRLDHPPEWAVEAASADSSFPFDVDAYLRFVDAVARRYGDHIHSYIIWNEPNLAAEWGAPPDPASYAQLLQRTYAAIKQIDPAATVVSAGLAPTNERSDWAVDDRLFLKEMYEAGARPYFDALAVHPYGFAYPPDDSRGQHNGLNVNRILDLRATMEAHGDGAKPVWATEVGWTTDGVGDHDWLTVTPQQQADYLTMAWRMARQDWPWLDVFTVWNLGATSPAAKGEVDEKAAYSLLYEDGRPKPAWDALQDAFSGTGLRRAALTLWERLASLLTDGPSLVTILALDQEIHLGDNQ
ncbi:MAG: YCF48-related protein [Chloroflexota bacterium]|nr:YCF48-related protein [Chloroflexota bacterium]